MMRWLALPLALCCAIPAQAKPAGAWRALSAEPFDGWHLELLFGTNRYFHEAGRGGGRQITTNLIDVTVYEGRGFQEPAWAFAVEILCPAGAVARAETESCRPVLRMVSRRTGRKPDWSTPATRGALARQLGSAFEWREADLRSCSAVMDRSLPFAGDASTLWPGGYLTLLKGEEPRPTGEVIVTRNDGPTVSVRVRAEAHPVEAKELEGSAGYSARKSGGYAYHWAFAMRDAVEPCLRTAAAVPPWEKALAQSDAPKQRSLEF